MIRISFIGNAFSRRVISLLGTYQLVLSSSQGEQRGKAHLKNRTMVSRQAVCGHLFFLQPSFCYTHGSYMELCANPGSVKAAHWARYPSVTSISLRRRGPSFRRSGMRYL
jgi:hypothetical protein